MKLCDAYRQACDEDDDPSERSEFSADLELKTIMAEEMIEAFKEIKSNKSSTRTGAEAIAPIFKVCAFFFIIGIRTGKILRNAEIEGR